MTLAGIPPAAAATPADAGEYRPTLGVKEYPLAFVGPDGVLRLAYPWFAPPVDLALARAGQAVSWGWDQDEGAGQTAAAAGMPAAAAGTPATATGSPVSIGPFICFISDQGVVLRLNPLMLQLRPTAVVAEPDENATWLPDDLVALDALSQGLGRLRFVDPSSGAVGHEIDFFNRWSPCPAGQYVALGVAKLNEEGKIVRSDLRLLDLRSGRVEILIRSRPQEFLMPIGWLERDVVAYRDARFPRQIKFVNIDPAAFPVPRPPPPLALTYERVGRLVPVNLRETWSGVYRVSPDENKLAIEIAGPDGVPSIYVGDLRTGKWYFVARGTGSTWGPEDASPGGAVPEDTGSENTGPN